jgi:hypothetical protein
MSLWDEMRSDAAEFLTDFGREVTFRKEKHIALIDSNVVQETFDVGGFTYQAGYRVRFYIENGGRLEKALPEFGERMEIYGKTYAIDKITYRPPSPWFDAYVIVYNQ